MAVVSPEAADTSAVAAALLATAEELGLPLTVVATTSDAAHGIGFVVPDEVANKFHKHMVSSQNPIRVDLEAAEEAAVEPEAELEPEKPKRAVGRPRKAAASAEPETEE